MSRCQHSTLSFDNAASTEISYRQPSQAQIRQALQVSDPPSKKLKTVGNKVRQGNVDISLPPASTFPPPIVVPGDELFQDPDYSSQTVQEWIDLEQRNKVTNTRRTIYVVAPPDTGDDVAFVSDWSTPVNRPVDELAGTGRQSEDCCLASNPRIADIVRYLEAFYLGMQVKILKKPELEFTAWDDGVASRSNRSRRKVAYVGLSIGSEAIRIRCRTSKDGIFSYQMNLDDLLDAAICILPKDAYALLMLVDHDLYEDEDDDFCCGRAYGGSRVCVVSTARYRPDLDVKANIELEHMWPASHCNQSIMRLCGVSASHRKKSKNFREDVRGHSTDSAMSAAVMASNALPLPSSPSELNALWLGRVCKTASHELGHCFGIAHCAYYACIMQATANLAEDSRQPPYLCPVDLSKVIRATESSEQERYRALAKFCEEWKGDRLFAAFGAWISSRLSSY